MRRRTDPADRRRRLVTLTPEGADAARRVQRIMAAPPPGFARLSAAELSALDRLLARVVAAEPGPANSPDVLGS